MSFVGLKKLNLKLTWLPQILFLSTDPGSLLWYWPCLVKYWWKWCGLTHLTVSSQQSEGCFRSSSSFSPESCRSFSLRSSFLRWEGVWPQSWSQRRTAFLWQTGALQTGKRFICENNIKIFTSVQTHNMEGKYEIRTKNYYSVKIYYLDPVSVLQISLGNPKLNSGVF